MAGNGLGHAETFEERQMRLRGGGWTGGRRVDGGVAVGAGVIPDSIGPQGVMQNMTIQISRPFKQGLEDAPEEVLRKMYDELTDLIRKRGIKL